MSLLTIALTVSLALSSVLMLVSLFSMTAGQSDRYLLMRLTLMKIASGEYENANVMAHRALDVVDDIDNEAVRQHYAGPSPAKPPQQ